MITYELGVELYECGFPLKKAEKLEVDLGAPFFGGTDTGYTVFLYPTLEELIEACRGYLGKIVWEGTDVYAYSKSGRLYTVAYKDAGVAVARFYIEINKKVVDRPVPPEAVKSISDAVIGLSKE